MGQQIIYGRLVGSERSVVQIGRVMQVAGVACSVQLHIEHLLGNRAPIAALEQARVLYGMLQIKEHTRRRAGVTLVYEHRPAP